jgi:hypothetical protein
MTLNETRARRPLRSLSGYVSRNLARWDRPNNIENGHAPGGRSEALVAHRIIEATDQQCPA